MMIMVKRPRKKEFWCCLNCREEVFSFRSFLRVMCLSLICVGDDKHAHLNSMKSLTMSKNDVVAGMRGHAGSTRGSGWNLLESCSSNLYHIKILPTP